MLPEISWSQVSATLEEVSDIRILFVAKKWRQMMLFLSPIFIIAEASKARYGEDSAVKKFYKHADQWELEYENGSILRAISFTNADFCGLRADIVILDEDPTEQEMNEIIRPLIMSRGPDQNQHLRPIGIYKAKDE